MQQLQDQHIVAPHGDLGQANKCWQATEVRLGKTSRRPAREQAQLDRATRHCMWSLCMFDDRSLTHATLITWAKQFGKAHGPSHGKPAAMTWQQQPMKGARVPI
jgi:hypothetical protein